MNVSIVTCDAMKIPLSIYMSLLAWLNFPFVLLHLRTESLTTLRQRLLFACLRTSHLFCFRTPSDYLGRYIGTTVQYTATNTTVLCIFSLSLFLAGLGSRSTPLRFATFAFGVVFWLHSWAEGKVGLGWDGRYSTAQIPTASWNLQHTRLEILSFTRSEGEEDLR